MNPFVSNRVIVRGAGDVASGIIHRLCRAGFEVIALEKPDPECVRRMVCFAEAFFRGEMEVQGVTAVLVDSAEQAFAIIGKHRVPLLIDPDASSLDELNPEVVVDGRMLKRNIDTRLDMAPIVIGLGPGFTAGKNCHAAIETRRGDDLGQALYSGSPQADTGVPAAVSGVTLERVLRSPTDGIVTAACAIGDMVKQGQTLARVNEIPVTARIDGIVRGMIHDGLMVSAGQKIGDIDPRGIGEYCYKISDKANVIAEGVLAALRTLRERMAHS
jgi:xanthine dehydrogenase accessory factor